MTWWVFNNATVAEAAQALCFKHLPDDTDAKGNTAGQQITGRWSDVVATTDGRFGIVAFDNARAISAAAALLAKRGQIAGSVTLPAGVTAMTDAQFAALLPPVVLPG